MSKVKKKLALTSTCTWWGPSLEQWTFTTGAQYYHRSRIVRKGLRSITKHDFLILQIGMEKAITFFFANHYLFLISDLDMPRTSTFHGDQVYEVLFESLDNCGRSVFAIQSFCCNGGGFHGNAKTGAHKIISRISKFHSDQVYVVSLGFFDNCGSSSRNKLFATVLVSMAMAWPSHTKISYAHLHFMVIKRMGFHLNSLKTVEEVVRATVLLQWRGFPWQRSDQPNQIYFNDLIFWCYSVKWKKNLI